MNARAVATRSFALLAIVLAHWLIARPAVAQTYVNLTNTNANSYTQNFDSLGTITISNAISGSTGVQTALGSAVNAGLNGWYAAKIGGTGAVATPITANNGSFSSGGVANYGSTNAPSNTDRSLGGLSSTSTIPGFGALIINETGQTLTGVQINFTAKFWRSSTTTQNVLTFGYGLVDGAAVTVVNFLTATGASPLAAANVVGPAPVSSNGPLDGNDPANQNVVSGLTIPQPLEPGQAMFIRWQDANDAGNDAGLAVDDLSLTALAGAPPATAPFVASVAVPPLGITRTQAVANSEVTGDGGSPITERGFVYAVASVNPIPTIGGAGTTNLPNETAEVGPMIQTITGLTAGTTYAVRSYASNAVGTTYSSVIAFNTLPSPLSFAGSYVESFLTYTGALPEGWAATSSSNSIAYGGAWGTGSSGGFRGVTGTTGPVLGYQHTGTTGTLTVSVTFVNATGALLDSLNISYLGRTAVPANTRTPDWVVSLDGAAVDDLAYSTGNTNGEGGAPADLTKSAQLTGLGIAPGAEFTVAWVSERGAGSGSSRQIGLADFSISSGDPSAPSIIPSPSSITNFSTVQGSESASRQVTVTGANLGGSNIEVTSSNSFYVISTNDFSTPGSTSLTLAPTGGVLSVRISSTAPATSNLTGSLALFGGGASNNVTLRGIVTVPATPTLSASPASLTGFATTQPEPSSAQTFSASGSNLSGNIVVVPPSGFQLSTNGTTYSSSLTLVPSGGTLASTPVSVRLTGSAAGTFSGNISLTGGGASPTNVAVEGTVSAPPPTLSATPASLTGFATTQPEPSSAQTFSASGSNLTGSITVVPPPGFELSTNGATYTSSLTLVPTGGNLASTPVSVRLTGSTSGTFSGNVSLTGGGAAPTNVSVSGAVIDPGAPSILPGDGTQLSGFATTRPNPSSNQFIVLSGSNLLSAVTVTPPPGWQISATNTDNYVASPVVVATNPAGVVSNTTINIRLAGTNTGATNYPGSVLTLVSGTKTNNILLSGIVNDPPPTLTVSTNALTNFSTTRPNPSTNQSFTVQGTNLTANVTITPPVAGGWQISTNSGAGTFTNPSITLVTNPAGVVSNTTIFVRLAGTNTVTTNYVGSALSVVSGGTNASVLLSGTVTVPAPSLALSTNILTNFSTLTNTPSTEQRFTVTGDNLAGNVTVTPTNGWQVTTNTNIGFFNGVITIPTNEAGAVSADVFLRIGSVPSATNFNNVPIRVVSGSTNLTLLASGEVTLPAGSPAITFFTPTNGPRGTLVTITGTNLNLPGTAVFFDRVPSSQVVLSNATQITAVVPPGADTGLITISNDVNIVSSTNRFTVSGLTLGVPPQIPAGYATPARVSIPIANPNADVRVFLFSDSPFASVPSSVLIPRGETSVFFDVQTISVGAPVPVRIDATSENYLAGNARTTVEDGVPLAASLTERGYTQDFSTFLSSRTLPLGWSNNSKDISYGLYSAWGTTNTGLKFSAPGTNVFGIQHEGSPRLNEQTLNLRNDTTSNITRLRLTYDGRTITATNPADRNPAYTVRVVSSSSAGTNTNTIVRLNYSTAEGDNVEKSDSIVMTNAAFPTGVPPYSTFTVSWSSSEGTGFDASKQIGISDVQFSLVRPTVTLTPVQAVNNFSTTLGSPSAPQPFNVRGQDLTGAIVVTAPLGFAVSTNTNAVSFTNSVTLPSVQGSVGNTQIFARLTGDISVGPGVVEGILRAESPNAMTPNASAQQEISGVVFEANNAAQVYASPTSIDDLEALLPAPSAPSTFYVSGRNLRGPVSQGGDIFLQASAGFQIRVGSTGEFSTGAQVTPDSQGNVDPTAIQVRLAGTLPVGAYSGWVKMTSSGIPFGQVLLTGQVVLPPAVITLQGPIGTGQFAPFTASRGQVSAEQSGRVQAQGLTSDLRLTVPDGFQVRARRTAPAFDTGWQDGSLALTPDAGGVVPETVVEVRIGDFARAGQITGNLAAAAPGATTRLLPVQGNISANTNAWIAARPPSLEDFSTLPGQPSAPKPFTVEAANITQNLRVAASAGYEISSDGLNWTNQITLDRVLTGGGGGGGGISIIGSDTASNYGTPAANTWTNGSNLGSGFGPWQFDIKPGTGGFAGAFIGDPSTASITGFPAPAFGLYGNPTASGAEATVNREFLTPLDVGQTFSFQWAINWDSDGGNKGFSIFAGSAELVNVNQGGFPGDITLNGTNTAIAFGSGPMTWSISTTSAGNLQVTSTARDGSTTPVFTTNLAIASIPTSVRWYASKMGSGDQRQPYFNNLQITAQGGGGNPGDVALTTLFVRLRGDAPLGQVNGSIDVSATPATARRITLSGRVMAAPVLTATPTSLVNFLTTAGQASAEQTFSLSGQFLAGSVSVKAPTGFEVRAGSGPFAPTVTLSPAGETLAATTIYVRVATNALAGDISANVVADADGFLGQKASASVALTGTVYAAGTAPQISLPNPVSLSDFSTTAGTASGAQSFAVSGVNLTGPITASVTAPYEISSGGAGGPYASTATSAAPAGGLLNGAEFHVRLAASATAANPATGTVTLTSPGVAANRTVAVQGIVLPTPTIALVPSAVNFNDVDVVAGVDSSAKVITVNGANLVGNVQATAPAPFQVSADGANWGSTATLNPAPSATLRVRVGSSASPGPANGQITFASQGLLPPVPVLIVAANVLPRPVITATPAQLGLFETTLGSASDAREFSVSGSNIVRGGITVDAPAKYEIATNSSGPWVSRITLPASFPPPAPGTPPRIIASDNGGNYGSGWNSGANGGTGFGPWTIVANSGNDFFAGNFIGDPAAAGITGMATNSFGLYANPPASAASVLASRPLNFPLQTNEALSFQWAVNFDTGSTNYKGFRIFAGSTRLLEVGQNGFPGDLRLIAGATTNTNLGIAYGTGPMIWTFAMTNPSTMRVTSTARTNTNTVAFATNITVTAAPDSFAWFAGAMSDADPDQRQPYYNNLQVTAPARSGGQVPSTRVFVRLKDTAPLGPANETIPVTCDYAEQRNVGLQGYVYPVLSPGLHVDPAEASYELTQGQASSVTTIRLDGNGLVAPVAVDLGNTSVFEYSLDNGATWRTSPASLPATPGGFLERTVQVRVRTTAPVGFHISSLDFTSGAFANSVALEAAVYANDPDPQILAAPPALAGFLGLQGAPSATQSFRASGINLLTNITIVAVGSNYELSTNGTTFTNRLTLRETGGRVAPTSVSVRLSSRAAVGANVTGAADLVAGTATSRVQFAGSVSTVPSPQIYFTNTGFIDFVTTEGVSSPIQSFSVGGTELQSDLVVTVPGEFRLSSSDPATATNNTFTNTALVIPREANGVAVATPLWLRLEGTNPVGPYNGFLDVSTALTNPWSSIAPFSSVRAPLTGMVFVSPLAPDYTNAVPNGTVRALGADPQGRLYLGGDFTAMVSPGGVTNPATNVARLEVNGAFDPTFRANPGGSVSAVLFAPTNTANSNAWVYVAGRFPSTNRITNAGVVTTNTNWSVLKRLFVGRPPIPDGTVDTNFAPPGLGSNATVNARGLALALQADGKVLVGGSFSNAIRRLNANGTIDTNFVATIDNAVNSIALQSDGKILIGGAFATVNGAKRGAFARLLADGSIDPTFQTNASASRGFNGPVNAVTVGQDGSIYVGGSFGAYGTWSTNTHYNLAKLQPNGTLVGDYNFTPGLGTNGYVYALSIRPGGELLVGGVFTNAANGFAGYSVNVGRLVQFLPDGTPDTVFNQGGVGATNNAVLALGALPNGNVAVGGSFLDFNNAPSLDYVAVLGDAITVPAMTSPALDSVPAGQPMSFQFTASPPGASIATVGTLPRGVTLNPDFTISGYPMDAGTFILTNTPSLAGKSGAPTPFALVVGTNPVSYSNWVKAWFTNSNTWTNASITGPSAVRSPSGLNNLQVYALTGGDPASTGNSAVPFTDFWRDGVVRYLTLRSGKYPLATNVRYSVEYSTNLMTPWLSGPDYITIMENTDSLLRARPNTPMGRTHRQFLRLKVTSP